MSNRHIERRNNEGVGKNMGEVRVGNREVVSQRTSM